MYNHKHYIQNEFCIFLFREGLVGLEYLLKKILFHLEKSVKKYSLSVLGGILYGKYDYPIAL